MDEPPKLLLIGSGLLVLGSALYLLAGFPIDTAIYGFGYTVLGVIHLCLALALFAASFKTDERAYAWTGLGASVAALFVGGGFIIGPIPGIIGAALALKAKK